MSDFYGHPYNYDASPYLQEPHTDLRQIMPTGERALDFTIPSLDGDEVTLSALTGKPVMIEFGSIT
jgi:hypothetical protein